MAEVMLWEDLVKTRSACGTQLLKVLETSLRQCLLNDRPKMEHMAIFLVTISLILSATYTDPDPPHEKVSLRTHYDHLVSLIRFVEQKVPSRVRHATPSYFCGGSRKCPSWSKALTIP
jgi:hypothetical protein